MWQVSVWTAKTPPGTPYGSLLQASPMPNQLARARTETRTPGRQGDEAVTKVLSAIVLVLGFAAFCFFIFVAVWRAVLRATDPRFLGEDNEQSDNRKPKD